MGDENPNAQVEANLLEGKGRYASAGTTLQDILNDLDSSAAGLQSSWLGGASQDFQDKQGKLATTVQSASDVLQKGSISIGKMYDSYIEADEKQKLQKEVNDVLEKFMGVFMLFTAALGVVGAILELADVAFAAEIGALEAVVEVGNVVPDVAADLGIEEVDTLSNLENISDIAPIEENPVPVDNPPEIPPQDAPVDPPQDAPAEPPQDAPAEPPQDTPVDPPQTDDVPPNEDQPSEAPAESENVEPPQTDDGSPNVDEPSGEPTPEPSKHDSAIDLSQDEQDFLAKILNEPKVSETSKEIAPPEPIQVNTVHTDVPDSPLTSPEYTPEDSPLTSPHYTPEDSPIPEPPKKVQFGDDQSTDFFRNDPPNTIEGLQPPSEAPQPGPSVLKQPPSEAPQPETEIDPIITEEDGLTDITAINGNTMTTTTYDSNGELLSVMINRWDEDLEMWVPYKEITDGGTQKFIRVASESPQTAPSQPPKRPFEEDPDSPPDPSDPKGKKKKF